MLGKSKFTLRGAVAQDFFNGDIVREINTGKLGEVIGMELLGTHFYRVSFSESGSVDYSSSRYVSSNEIELVKPVEDRFLELDEEAIEVLNKLRNVMYERLGADGYEVLLSEKKLFEELLKVIEVDRV